MYIKNIVKNTLNRVCIANHNHFKKTNLPLIVYETDIVTWFCHFLFSDKEFMKKYYISCEYDNYDIMIGNTKDFERKKDEEAKLPFTIVLKQGKKYVALIEVKPVYQGNTNEIKKDIQKLMKLKVKNKFLFLYGYYKRLNKKGIKNGNDKLSKLLRRSHKSINIFYFDENSREVENFNIS